MRHQIEGTNGKTIEVPAPVVLIDPSRLEFLRLPPVGTRCGVTGLSRAALNELILPTPRNGNKPPVRSFCMRQKGAASGIRIIDYQSLRDYIHKHEEVAA